MSLDNTSHPGGPGHDELVPSRYALRVGDIDVLVVSDGVLIAARRDVGPQRRPGRPGGLAERHVPAADTSTVTNTAPVNFTACNTSDSASAPMPISFQMLEQASHEQRK